MITFLLATNIYKHPPHLFVASQAFDMPRKSI
jgi:hypothetical protein